MGTSKAVQPAAEPNRQLALIERFSAMAESIPLGTDDTGLANILGQIEGARDVEALDNAWDALGGEKVAGRVIVVNALKRQPSDYAEGLPFFLVVTATDNQTGEVLTFTTGSVSVAGQLVKAHAEGWLPLKCELVIGKKNQKTGFTPQHLRVYGKGDQF